MCQRWRLGVRGLDLSLELGPSACRERPGQWGDGVTWTAGEWGERCRRRRSVRTLEALAGLLLGQ